MAALHTHESRDIDDHAESLSGFHQFYEQLGRGRFHGAVWQLMMQDGCLLRESSNRSLRQHFTAPAERVTLAMPLAVAEGSVFAGRPLARESLLLLTDDDEYELVTTGDFDLVGLSVHRSLVDALAPAKADWLRRAEARRHLPLSPDAAAAIRLMLMAVAADAARQVDGLADPGAERALLSSTLTQTVLLALSGSSPDAVHGIPRRADSRMKVVRRALAFMREHLHDDIGIPEVCAAACASRRSLQYCFEEFLHTTPQACLRALRLNEARRLLKARGEMPIAELASELGFASASHFTRHYKLMFDELPSATLKARGVRAPTHGS